MKAIWYCLAATLFTPLFLEAGLIPSYTVCPAGWTLIYDSACLTSGGSPSMSFVLSDNGNPATPARMFQAVSGLVTGETYTLTLDYKTNSASSSLTNAVGVGIDGQLFLFDLYNDSVWRTYTTNFTYTGTSDFLSISPQPSGSSNVLELSNIDINLAPPAATPEPSTFLLSGGSAVLLLLARRRL